MADRSAASSRCLAVLIDAENIPASAVPPVLDEIAKLGSATVKRAYGDFTNPALAPWRAVLLEHAIQPMQQFSNIPGKNAADSALIIDAMDLLHSRRVAGFCIVSSDSDFTRLATRIREDGLPVYGFGEKKTPDAFVRACSKFTHTEHLAARGNGAKGNGHDPGDGQAGDKLPLKHLRRAITSTRNESGWARLRAVGNMLKNEIPNFDPRTYGHPELVDLIKASGLAKFKYLGPEGSGQQVFVRLRD